MTIVNSANSPNSGLLAAFGTSRRELFGTIRGARVLIVGGGGGGGFGYGGGGGGGAVIQNPDFDIAPGSYTIVVGGGGQGNQNNAQNNTGGSSSAFGLTATGGGSGANESGDDTSGRNGTGGAGANAGGSSWTRASTAGTPIPTITSRNWVSFSGRSGGAGLNIRDPWYGMGGGGGSGNNGDSGSQASSGNGGTGVYDNILGTGFWWGAGGGAAAFGTNAQSGRGGLGGGGGGAPSSAAFSGAAGRGAYNAAEAGFVNSRGGNAGINTGSGGGGGANENEVGGNGGSGIVVIRYPGPQRAAGGQIITRVGDSTVHIFNSVGSHTFTVYNNTNNSPIISAPNLYGTAGSVAALGTATYVTEFGGGIQFTSASSHSLRILPANYNFNVINLTVSVWYRPSSVGDSFRRILQRSDTTGATRGFVIAQGVASSNRLVFVYQPNYTTGEIIRRANTVFANNTTYHIAMTYSVANGLRVYVNGVLDTNNSPDPLESSWTAGTGSEFALGRRTNATDQYFNGTIYSAKIYNRELTSSEISKEFSAMRSRFGL